MKKKLIEVAMPLVAINKACVKEASPFTPRHPRSLHVWWARRRLAAARAVIFGQMVDDPSAHPNQFPTEESQEQERQRLFRLIEELVKWENTTNKMVLSQAQDEIWKSWRTTCAENKNHPQAAELFNPDKLPAFHDPFAGGGAFPLEAQRLGLEAYASDLNPVAVLINKAMIEIPPKFAGQSSVNPEAPSMGNVFADVPQGARRLAEDVRYYAKWVRDEAEKRIGHLYSKIEITTKMSTSRPDLKPLVGQKLIVNTWLWARTVKSPNPAFANAHVPLASTFMLSTKKSKEAYVEPLIDGEKYRFTVKIGKPKDNQTIANGTKVGRGGHFRCLLTGTPISVDYIREQGKAGRLGARLIAIVAEGKSGRVYIEPNLESEETALGASPTWVPELNINHNPRDIRPQLYGLTKYSDLFTPRQLVSLTTFSDLIRDVHQLILRDALESGMSDDGKPLRENGMGATAYAEAVRVYLSLALSRWTDLFCTLSAWNTTNQNIKNLFSRHAIPMVWDYAESNPFGNGASFSSTIETIYKLSVSLPSTPDGHSSQLDARLQSISANKVVSTDPPYYDNICYADLSDFFYVWLRRSLKSIYPDLLTTMAVPKAEELVATPYRHGDKEKAETFFLDGMTQVMKRLAEQAHPDFPVTIYYAFRQSESKDDSDTASTGWETFLDAVIHAGFSISGTWPMRTERTEALKKNTNALASSIILVCRPRPQDSPAATRRDFLNALKRELPKALAYLQRGNIAPVDLQQSAIGPGMAVFTRYAKVLDAEGNEMRVHDALVLINQTLDEVLAEQEGDLDADSRWALSWFEHCGFAEGEYGVAETLSKAKNISVDGMVEAGIAASKAGKVRLLKPDELPDDWDPTADSRLTVWETVHHLVRVLEEGEIAAGELVRKLGSKAETARELAYRLYTVCERKKWAQEALAYNSLVQSWPEIIKLARQAGGRQTAITEQDALFEQE